MEGIDALNSWKPDLGHKTGNCGPQMIILLFSIKDKAFMAVLSIKCCRNINMTYTD